jgi:hypothetical protein
MKRTLTILTLLLLAPLTVLPAKRDMPGVPK